MLNVETFMDITEYPDNYTVTDTEEQTLLVEPNIDTTMYTESEYRRFEKVCEHFQQELEAYDTVLLYDDLGYEYWHHLGENNQVKIQIPKNRDDIEDIISIVDQCLCAYPPMQY